MNNIIRDFTKYQWIDMEFYINISQYYASFEVAHVNIYVQSIILKEICDNVLTLNPYISLNIQKVYK